MSSSPPVPAAVSAPLPAAALNIIRMGVIIVNADQRVVFWNYAATQLIGPRPYEAMGHRFPDDFAPTVFAHPRFTALYRQALTSRDPVPYHPADITPPGRALHNLAGTFYPWLAGDGQSLGTVITVKALPRRPEMDDRHGTYFQCFRDSDDAIAITDTLGTILDVNPAFTRIYGYSREEAIGQNHRILRNPQTPPALYEQMWRDILQSNRGYWKGEIANLRKDGREVPVLLTITPMRDDEGNIVGYMGISIDRSELRSMQKQVHRTEKLVAERTRELATSEEKYRDIFEQAPTSMILIDEHGVIQDVNPRFLTEFGRGRHPRAHFQGLNLIEYPMYQLSGLSEKCRRLLREGVSFDVQEAYSPASPGGTPVYFNAKGVPIRKEDALIGAITILENLTERKRLERLIRISQEKYRSIIRDSHDGIAMVENGRFVEVNEAFARMCERTVVECVGLPAETLVPHPFQESDWEKMAATGSGSGDTPTQQVDVVTASGRRRTWRITVSPLQHRAGAVSIIARDVTHERQQAEQLIQQEKLAAIGLLTAGVAHEIGNPISSISALLQVWAMDHLDQQTTENTGVIRRHLDRISGVVNQMLEFARPPQMEWRWCDVHEIIDSALELAQYDRRIRRITIDRRFASDLPRTAAMPEGLRQVFLNLIINAFDAMGDQGALTITTGTEGRRLWARLSDTGGGMSDEARRRAFEPFFTTKDVGKGTGMGLAVSYSLMQKHDGTIEIEENSAQGANLRVWIPIRDREDLPHRHHG